MKRIALIAASTAAAIAASLAMAQPQPIPPAGGGSDNPRQERTDSRESRRDEWRERRAERMQERMNERLAKLRTDMKLKPEQVAAFDRIEALVKKGAEDRRARWSAMRDQRENFRHADIMERLDMMSGRQSERAARSKELADAVRPLWTTLSDEQKTVARRAIREAMSQGRERMQGMRDHMRDNMDERRGGRDRDDDDRGPRRGRDEWRDRRG